MLKNLVTSSAGALLAVVLSSPLLAAELSPVRITSPILGYIFDDSAKSIRRVSGVPGAANLDAPLDLGGALQSAFINSSARLAVGLTKEGGITAIRWTELGQTQSTILQTGLGTLKQAALSGTFAILSDGITVEVWSNLADQPSRVGQYPVSGSVIAVAINKDGAAAVATGAGQILGFDGGNTSIVASGGNWTAIAFSGSDLLAADGTSNELARFADALHNPTRSLVEKLGSAAVSLAISRDGSLAAVAFSDDLAVVTLAGGVAPVSCSCQTKSFNTLDGNLVLQLAGTGGQTLILDADNGDVRVIQLPGSTIPVTNAAGDSAQ